MRAPWLPPGPPRWQRAGGGKRSDSGAGGGNTLKVWAWDPTFNIAALKEAERIYKKDHPDFSLDVVEMVWDDVQQKITTLAQSQDLDQLPDIFLMQNMAAQKNIDGYPDVFSDFSDSKVDFSQFPEFVTSYSTYDGVNYGLPFDSGTSIGAWRTDFLQQAGYTIDDLTDITWSRLLEIGKDVKAKIGKPMMASQAGGGELIPQLLQSAGASLFKEDGSVNMVGNDALLAAIDVYKSLVDEGVITVTNAWDEYIGALTGDQVVGVVNGIWITANIQTATAQSGKWAVTNVPALDGVSGATNYTSSGGSSWAISATASYDLAADFLASTFAGSVELYDTILPTTGAVANWIPAGQSDVYSKPVDFYGGQAIYADVVAYSEKVPASTPGPYFYEARDALIAATTQIVGGADVTESLKSAEETATFAMGG